MVLTDTLNLKIPMVFYGIVNGLAYLLESILAAALMDKLVSSLVARGGSTVSMQKKVA